MRTSALLSTGPGVLPRPASIDRRELRRDDVDVRVTFCGVCHSDLHALHGGPDGFPLVPGHEFVGEVVSVGDAVVDFAPGDPVAVGNIVDSCGTCRMCLRDEPHFCEQAPTTTYGGRDRVDGTTTSGAWSGRYVVRDRFVFHRPPELDPAGVAPLMCASLTVWTPLRSADVGPGSRVGVVGLGGLGHLAVRLAHALGAAVTVFTTTEAKAEDAGRLGADRTVVSTDEDAMQDAAGSLDVIIDTVAADHDLKPYLHALDLDGTLFSVGHLGPVQVDTLDLTVGRKRLSSSGGGGARLTRDLLAFCAEHGITADVEVLPTAAIATALERLERNDVRYRFVLDLSDLPDPAAATAR